MIEEQKGAAEAENILEELGFDVLPIVPEKVARAVGNSEYPVVIESHNFDSEKILGKATGNDRGALIYINANIPDRGRYNFTAGHELGHVCMHIMTGQTQSFECGTNEFYNPHTDPIEKEANGFASGLLMPKTLIRPLTNAELNWFNINCISEKCGTSLEATYRRFRVLDNSPSAMVIHENGRFRRFVVSDNFSFFLQRSSLSHEQKCLCVDTKADGYPADYEEVDAIDWVNPERRGTRLETIYASSILLNDGFTYTLLTYDDDCYSYEED